MSKIAGSWRGRVTRPWARSALPFLLVNCCCRCCSAEDDDEALRQARLAAKPWYTKNVQIGGTTLPVSYVTVVVVFLSVFYLFYNLSGDGCFCEASHILLQDQSDDTKKKMEGWKKKIGSDAALFAQYARENSTCPSKRNGGKLGKFPKHQMAPPFDRACFDPQSPVGATIGPIQTQFGWHLIYIHDRKIS